jgi:hypothetical protein
MAHLSECQQPPLATCGTCGRARRSSSSGGANST